MQPGRQPNGTVKGLLFEDSCTFDGNGTHIYFYRKSTIKYEDRAVLRNCILKNARERAAYINVGKGAFYSCLFENNHDEKRDGERKNSSDINFFAMDYPDTKIGVDEFGFDWVVFRPNSELDWIVSGCTFMLSERFIKSQADPRDAEGVREAITVAVVDPDYFYLVTGKDGQQVRVYPRGYEHRIDRPKYQGRVKVTVDTCMCVTNEVKQPPPPVLPGKALQAVFIRTHVAGLDPRVQGRPSLSSNWARDWEWVYNPGRTPRYADEPTARSESFRKP